MFATAPVPVVRAARGRMARAVLVAPDGHTQELELASLKFVYYERTLIKRGKWEKTEEHRRPRSTVRMKAKDHRYESRYLQWENGDPGVRLTDLCEIRISYPSGKIDPPELTLEYTTRKGRTVTRKVLDLLGAYQPEPVHFTGKVVKGEKRDFPLPPIRSDGPAAGGPVLSRIEFLYRACTAR